MHDNFEKCLKLVLAHEGGFSDSPKDPGGATMKGVTLKTFKKYYGASRTVDDLLDISENLLYYIYLLGYWDKCRCEELPAGVDYSVFDFAVNSGPSRSLKLLQFMVGADVDGIVGPDTTRRANTCDPIGLINEICDHRHVFLSGLNFLSGLKSFATFGKGWTKRVEDVRRDAISMADERKKAKDKEKTKPFMSGCHMIPPR